MSSSGMHYYRRSDRFSGYVQQVTCSPAGHLVAYFGRCVTEPVWKETSLFSVHPEQNVRLFPLVNVINRNVASDTYKSTQDLGHDFDTSTYTVIFWIWELR